MSDTTGAHAGVNQPDDVWFLAGSFGRDVQRQCIVPANRPLFLPAFNCWYFPAVAPVPRMSRAAGSLFVDGVPVTVDEVAVDQPFEVCGARRNPVTRTRSATTATVWGLWKLLPPLAPGGHEVHITGGDGHGFRISINYQLTVAEPGG